MDPRIGLVHSPRSDWSATLHHHLANHGGATVRRMIVEPGLALEGDLDVIICEDTTSFLSQHFAEAAKRAGAALLGVYVTGEDDGRERLERLGFEGVIESEATVDEFLSAIRRVAPARNRSMHALADPDSRDEKSDARPGLRIVVGAATGGCGASEVSLGLADALAGRSGTDSGERGECVLIDADDVSPSLPVRLNLPLTPNVRNAVDAHEHRLGDIESALLRVDDAAFCLLNGPPRPGDWTQLRIPEVTSMLETLAGAPRTLVVNAGHRREDLTEHGGVARYALTREMFAMADVIVGVGAPSPVGVVDLIEWACDVRDLAPQIAPHLVVNRVARSAYKQAEIEAEILRNVSPASLTFLSEDRRVGEAAWSCTPVARGAFTRGVAALAGTILQQVSHDVERFPMRLGEAS